VHGTAVQESANRLGVLNPDRSWPACARGRDSRACKPATFDQSRYFVLDRDPLASCEACRRNNDCSRDTCRDHQDHARASIRAGPVEQGLPDFRNRAQRHRGPRLHETTVFDDSGA
jgi:hypothetical protein